MKKKDTKDRHKSGFMVRLPERYRVALLLLKERERRPISSEVQLAIEAHLKAKSIKLPPA